MSSLELIGHDGRLQPAQGDMNMSDDTMSFQPQAAEPSAALRRLNRLAGTWAMSGDVQGTVTYAWMEGGFFLIQHVDLVQQDGQRTTGMEVIGHLHPYGAEPSVEIHSRYYDSQG